MPLVWKVVLAMTDRFDELAREDLKRVGWPINVDLWDVLEEWKREALLELAAIRRDTWNDAIEVAAKRFEDSPQSSTWYVEEIRAFKVESHD